MCKKESRYKPVGSNNYEETPPITAIRHLAWEIIRLATVNHCRHNWSCLLTTLKKQKVMYSTLFLTQVGGESIYEHATTRVRRIARVRDPSKKTGCHARNLQWKNRLHQGPQWQACPFQTQHSPSRWQKKRPYSVEQSLQQLDWHFCQSDETCKHHLEALVPSHPSLWLDPNTAAAD